MPSSLLSGSVKSSPGGYGRLRPLLGTSTCRLGSKRPIAYHPLRVNSASSPSSTAVISHPPSPEASPPSDFKASPVPLLLLPPHILDKKVGLDPKSQYAFYSLSETEHVAVEKNTNRPDPVQIEEKKHKSSAILQIADDLHWIGTSKGWIMSMSRRDGSLYLFSPLSPSTSPIVALPPIETLSGVTAHRGSETEVTDYKFVLADWFRKKDIIVPAKDLVNEGFISRFAVSSAYHEDLDLSDCIVAIVYGLHKDMAFCRLGDTVWSPIEGSGFKQLLFSKHHYLKLFVVTWPGQVKCCTFPFQKWKELKDISDVPSSDHEEVEFHYLVESATEPDHLIMAIFWGRDYHSVDVHKLNLSDPNKKWVRVDGLGDQTLFVGDFSETLSVPAPQLPPKVKPNYIYYTNFKIGELGAFSLDNDLEDDDEGIEAYQGLQIDLLPNVRRLSYRTWMKEYRKKSEGWLLWVATYPRSYLIG